MAARKKVKVSKKTVKKVGDNNQNIIVLGLALVTAIGGYLYLKNMAPKEMVEVPQPRTATVALSAQNKSNQSGAATLKEMEGKVLVTLSVTPGAKGVPQPAHIHLGSCPTPGDVKYPLTSVIDGMSETTVNVTYDELMKGGLMAINIHKSQPQVKTYVVCGDVKLLQ